MTENPREVLAKAIRSEIVKLRQVQKENAGYRAEFAVREPDSIGDLRKVAGGLVDIYQGAENVFRRVVKTTGESEPSGADWHQSLLEQMEREITDIRPIVIRLDTRSALQPFRKFRHRARHIYGFEFTWDEMKPLLEMADAIVNMMTADFETFCAWLDHVGIDEI